MNGNQALSVDMPTGLRNKIMWRLIPLLSLLYVLNIMDRMNVGYARTKMEADLDISSLAFTTGFGIFYIGYLFFEVPANLILQRVGARRWMARIMVSWGLVSCATALVFDTWSFFLVRILLGVAEAGFFPGIVLYLTYWFPSRERGKAMALFMTGTAISGVVSNLVSGQIMQHMPGVWGLRGWHWLFILEGLPSVLVGLFVYYYLPDGPRSTHWLTPAEQDAVTERLRREDAHRHKEHGGDMWLAMRDWRVWLLIVAYFAVAVGTNCGAASFAKMIHYRFWDYSESWRGALVALPSFCALLCMILMGQLSDRTGLRRTIFAICGLIGAAGWLIVLIDGQPWPMQVPRDGPAPVGDSTEMMASRWILMAGFCIAQAGMMSMIPTFWVMPTSFLSGTAAAAGIALINSFGNLGGYLGPYFHEFAGNGSMLAILVLGAMVIFRVRHDPTLDRGLHSGEAPT